MNFWKDGISIRDYEKLLLGSLLTVCVGIGCYKYIQSGDISDNWCNLIYALGGLFTVRKIFTYFKNENYSESTEQTIDTLNDSKTRI